jgi:phage shock protein PspC (stress-responsive transcriptional regulator)
MNNKKLYRNTDDKMVAGVLSGLAEYFGWDVTLVRLGFVGTMIITRVIPLTVLYILAAFIIPEKPKALPGKPAQENTTKESSDHSSQSDHQTTQ